mgnify:CR=1 FL=1
MLKKSVVRCLLSVDFSYFCKKLRKEKGLTQTQLAEKLNITDKAVSKESLDMIADKQNPIVIVLK